MPRIACFPLLLAFLFACVPTEPAQRALIEPLATSTPSATSTPIPTSTPSPTPTATAPAAIIRGDLRSPLLAEPVRQSGAPCGFVDILDFPLDPPDGAAARGGRDFGRFRSRFDGYHTGEDWGIGSSSFGQPVYSIAHGRVTFAQPNGWGADKGVIIVEHTFRDRRRILSFYGHLDPPSVDLRAGQCVERGDQIANIGDPRSPPHLHFEIRVHLPGSPGPGYWSVDPTLSGWRPPSATIWSERIAALAGVRWILLNESAELQTLGMVGGDLLVSSDLEELMALSIEDGSRLWVRSLPESSIDLLFDERADQIYFARLGGSLEAFRITDLRTARAESIVDPLWTASVGSTGSVALFPLPQAGVVVSTGSQMSAFSDSGELLWRGEPMTGIRDWTHSGESLILLGREGVSVADESGSERSTPYIMGHRIVASDLPVIYAEDGVYRFDLDTHSVEPFFSLPRGFPRSGAITELPGGGILVAHIDLDDRRLIAIDAEGALVWERSLAGLGVRAVDLSTLDDQVFLVAQFPIGNSTGIDLFQVDTGNGALTRIFSGGTRASGSLPLTISVAGNLLLISIEDVGLTAFEPQAALRAVDGE